MDIRNVTVVGAGNMGAGIAQSWAQAGHSVRLHDVSEDAIRAGLQRVEDPLRKRVEAGKMKASAVDAIMANLTPASDLSDAVADADLVVEAVFEDLKVKTDLFRRLDAACPDKTLLATNTSSLRVADLAAATKRRDRVVGLHYFFPAAINKLVEVVAADATDPGVAADVEEAVRRAGKIPIRTADAPGFCVNRFFVPWINEACRIVEEGEADIPTVEAAAKEAFGIAMGPFQLMNVTGVPISLHAQSTLHEAFGPFYRPSDLLRQQVDAKKEWDLAGTADKARRADVAGRLRGVVYAIACALAEEGVATPKDTDHGATIGLRWRQGPFAMMNSQGPAQALTDVQGVAARWPDGFPSHTALADHAAASTQWHIPGVVRELLDEGTVAVVTLDRPEALNALDPGILRDLDACLDAIEAEGSVRAVVLTGSGKAFVAGADIPTMRALDAQGARDYTALGNRVLDRLSAFPCPVVMAINGHALGGGLELALCGDLLYASDKAMLGLPEVGLGIHPGFGGTQRLPRRVGPGVAKDLVFTGRTITAEEAAGIGLLNAVVPHGQLMDRVLDVARTIAGKAPLAVSAAKHAIDRGMGMDLASGLSVEQESVTLLFDTRDKDEGLDAFLERRQPVFRGH